MHKKYRPFVKAARKHGGMVVNGGKHIKVYNGDRLIAVISGNTSQFEGKGDMQLLRKLWRQEGWIR